MKGNYKDLDEVDIEIINLLKQGLHTCGDIQKKLNLTVSQVASKLIKIEKNFPIYEETLANRDVSYKILNENEFKINVFELLNKELKITKDMYLKTKDIEIKKHWKDRYFKVKQKLKDFNTEELAKEYAYE